MRLLQWPSGGAEHPPPETPFSLSGYTCFSLVHNCSPKHVQSYLSEYPCAIPPECGGSEYLLRIASLPDAPRWTAVSWPRPASFFDMQMVTMGLHGQSKPYAGEKFALFLALPDEAHREDGPLLTLPYKSGFHMEVRDQMLGIFCQWEFLYNIGRDNVTFRRFEKSPNYTSYLCTPRIGFQMKWMERLEESRWLEFPLFLNNSVHCERNAP